MSKRKKSSEAPATSDENAAPDGTEQADETVTEAPAEAPQQSQEGPPEATTKVAAEPVTEKTNSGGGSRLPVMVAGFALIFATLAILVSGSLWWQYREFYVSLDGADNVTELALEEVRASIRRADDRLVELADQFEVGSSELATVAQRLNTVPGRFADLERRIDAAQGGTFDVRENWLRAEAEYYLAVANTELTLAAHWENAIAALEQADTRLRELADPALAPVRELIAGELVALRAVSLPDIEGLAFTLGRLSEGVSAMPFRNGPAQNFSANEPSQEDIEPGLGRLWQGLGSAAQSLFSIEHREEPVAMLLSAEEGQLTQRQLMLELQLARLAAIRGQQQVFLASLGAAISLLEQDFDSSAQAVEGAVALLGQMTQFDIAPLAPDISRSLNRLRSLPAGEN